jgi:hypothetical protein
MSCRQVRSQSGQLALNLVRWRRTKQMEASVCGQRDAQQHRNDAAQETKLERDSKNKQQAPDRERRNDHYCDGPKLVLLLHTPKLQPKLIARDSACKQRRLPCVMHCLAAGGH